MTKQKPVQSVIHAKDTEIAVLSAPNRDDYISLTDIAKYRNSTDAFIVVNNWLRLRDTIEFLGLWEKLNNPNFNPIEFDRFKNESGANAFTLSPTKWISKTNAVGLVSKSGRYGGGTFAHKDIAFEFASWISPEFKLYIIKDYQRLKEDENHRLSLDWSVKRILSKANYRIHTDAIKKNLISSEAPAQLQGYIYAGEADLLNTALFGKTAAQWKHENPDLEGNMRDYATIEQLLVLSNLEALNAHFIEQKMSPTDRLLKLNEIAREQLKQIAGTKSATTLKNLHNQPQLPTNK